VYLPREAAEAECVSGAACREYPGGSEVVLLVEDEPLVRRLGTKVLERCGYTVLAAESGARALVVAEEYDGEIHLLLTDVVMPGMSGRELAEQLLPRRPAMRLLYTSGYTEDAIVHHGVSGRGTAFLEKPYSPESLAGKVREALAGARAAQSV
jgi:CheY-like chemotaxis protein